MSVNLCYESSVLSTGLSALYMRQEFTDLRIICSDGELMAHTSVLSAVSDRLRQILVTCADNNTAPTLLIVADIATEDIKAIVDIVYFGRQSVSPKRAKYLTQMADKFAIKLTTTAGPHKGSDCGQQSTAEDLSHCTEQKSKSKPKPKKRLDIRLDQLFAKKRAVVSNTGANNEKPLDLSLSKDKSDYRSDGMADRIAESIAANCRDKTRRRKQSDPKPIVREVVGFEANEDNLAENTEPFDAFEDQMSDTSADVSAQLAVDSEAEIPFQFDTSPEMLFKTDDDICCEQPMAPQKAINRTVGTSDSLGAEAAEQSSICERQIVLSYMTESIGAVAQQKTNRKSDVKSGRSGGQTSTSNCSICGQDFKSLNQLVIHLKKAHKSSDSYKCSECGKEQKYAKTFALHSTQCGLNSKAKQ